MASWLPDHENINFLEDDTLYEGAIKKLEDELAKGKTLEQACQVLSAVEQALKSIIIDDFLQMIIAEYHFGKGRGIDDIALLLGVPYEKVESAKAAMLMDLNQTFGAGFENEFSHMTH